MSIIEAHGISSPLSNGIVLRAVHKPENFLDVGSTILSASSD